MVTLLSRKYLEQERKATLAEGGSDFKFETASTIAQARSAIESLHDQYGVPDLTVLSSHGDVFGNLHAADGSSMPVTDLLDAVRSTYIFISACFVGRLGDHLARPNQQVIAVDDEVYVPSMARAAVQFHQRILKSEAGTLLNHDALDQQVLGWIGVKKFKFIAPTKGLVPVSV